ncbi:RNA-directed DNA polymerase, eukaryota, reverse transcriptase zinc-binding domain protein [Tanacetum coccineum]|uniref:RNA-directed DNA polymerase, eukaryota, reverse transcriptase zinc-binding domain protein n=1 Tax=Tanacetum coccineum TaxID=301880 RepID=A0ABQ5AM51_9ASTR
MFVHLQWCKLKKKHSFILKIDFEKAYDSVRWDYLDDVLRKFGFGEKWCGWIQECLRSSWGSVLVNGSPTEEFQFFKGLKQGDPLSPFIFILVMESLHISFKRVVDAGMFNGIVLNSVMHLSHMFYADDAVFMGQWSTKNIDTIIYVLKCFHRASGLSINLSKSKLLGVVVSEDRVVQAANRIGCGVLKAPFAYLGSKVGGNMSRIKSWDEIVDKMVDRLSKWKMKTLSIGGRLTLLKAVLGSMPIYHMSIFKVPMKVLQRMESIRSRFFSGVDLNSKKSIWVKWSKVLCSKEKGGLGVSSLYALNRALMCKWVWRFTTQKNLLWTRVIKAIHGEDGKNGSGFKVGYKSIWRSILQEVETLKIKGIHLNNFMQKKLGNGADTYFWEDLWHGDMVLKQRYPRLYALEVKKTVDVASKLSQENLTWSFRRAPRSGVEQDQLTDLTTYVEGVVLGVTPDRWYWTLDGSGEFSVASARKVIDDNRFPEVSTQTRWIKAVPIKVNIHAWKVRMDCLPTRLNISRRGIDIPSILCPVCGSVTESSSHLFFDCLVAKDNFRKICRWWEVDFMEVHTFDEWVSWIVNLRIPIKHKRCCVDCGKLVSQDTTFVKGADGSVTLFTCNVVIGEIIEKYEIRSCEHAKLFYQIAVERGFTRGRRTAQVAAACLYVACREQEQPFLLIEFSSELGVSVYKLGIVYLQLCQLLSLQDHSFIQKPVDPSLYMHRYTSALLGKKNNKNVLNTALRLAVSMKRDWMQTGRKPSGICAAAIYVSSLLHGYKFTKTDVVKVVHICEATLTKRLIEFENTKAGSLTVSFIATLKFAHLLKSSIRTLWIMKRNELLQTTFYQCLKDARRNRSGLEPPAFQRAETQRLAKESAEEVQRASPVSGKLSDTPGAFESSKDVPDNDTVVDETQTLSEIDDFEISCYLNNEEESHFKKIIWELQNKEYMQEQAVKEAASKLTPEETKAKEALKKKAKANKDLEAKNAKPPQTAAEAAGQHFTKKRLSSKINYDALDSIFGDEPNAKKNRPDDDADNVEEPGNENKETNEAGSVVEEDEEEDVTYLIMKMKHKVMNGTIITNTNVTY